MKQIKKKSTKEQPFTSDLTKSTLQVSKDILDSEVLKDWKEARMAFLSVWVCANDAFKIIADLMEQEDLDDRIRSKIEPFYKSVPVAFNAPLFVRVPPALQGDNLAKNAESARTKAGAPGPIVVQGYNDETSLKEWENYHKEQAKQ